MTAIADRIVALAWVIVGGIVFVAAGDISSGGANALDALGPKAFPQAIGIILSGLGVWLLVADPIAKLIGRPRVETDQPPAEPQASADVAAEEPAAAPPPAAPPSWRVPAAIAITVAYVVFLPIIHYVAATLIAGVSMMALLGARRISLLIVYPVVLTFAAQYAFTEIVGVILP